MVCWLHCFRVGENCSLCDIQEAKAATGRARDETNPPKPLSLSEPLPPGRLHLLIVHSIWLIISPPWKNALMILSLLVALLAGTKPPTRLCEEYFRLKLWHVNLSFFIHKVVPSVMFVWNFVMCGTDVKHLVFSWHLTDNRSYLLMLFCYLWL